MTVLIEEPGQCVIEFVSGWSKRYAIKQVSATIAKREEFALEQVSATERREHESLSIEDALHPLAPTRGQHVTKLHRAVVEPTVDKLETSIPLHFRKVSRSGGDRWR